MKTKIRELRVRVDGLAQLCKGIIRRSPMYNANGDYIPGKRDPLTPVFYSREIEQAVDSLYLAKAWLGKCLESLGEDTPYSTGKKTVEDIEPTADTINMGEAIGREYTLSTVAEFGEMNHIEKVDWLRSKIQKAIDEILTRDFLYEIDNGLVINNTWTHLCEAKFQLGFEMARIREEGK
jgi:hypothetical protein